MRIREEWVALYWNWQHSFHYTYSYAQMDSVPGYYRCQHFPTKSNKLNNWARHTGPRSWWRILLWCCRMIVEKEWWAHARAVFDSFLFFFLFRKYMSSWSFIHTHLPWFTSMAWQAIQLYKMNNIFTSESRYSSHDTLNCWRFGLLMLRHSSNEWT